MYGKWIDIIQRVRNETPEERYLETGTNVSNNEPLRNTPHSEGKETTSPAEEPKQNSSHPCKQTQVDERPPAKEDFDIPPPKRHTKVCWTDSKPSASPRWRQMKRLRSEPRQTTRRAENIRSEWARRRNWTTKNLGPMPAETVLKNNKWCWTIKR